MKRHSLKHWIVPFLLLAILSLTGCTSKYFDRLDGLWDRVDALQAACDKINKDLEELQKLIQAINEQDMITGITEIQENGVTTGYKINFVNHDPVTILHGRDGDTPIISSKYDNGNYYWTVQYGNGNVQWLLDPDGNKILATGKLPYLTIRDGMWCYTLNGKDYFTIGKAEGEPGDKVFSGIDTSEEGYVTIILANGQKLKIPTYDAYLSLKARFETVNQNAHAQAVIIQATLDKLTYLTDVQPIMSGTDTVGLTFHLSNGKEGEIHDWTSAVTPIIFAKKDTDGQLYWAYEFGTLGVHWVLDPDNNKIPASSEPAEAPLVDVKRESDGQWYWTVTYKGSTELLRFPVEGGYAPHALDSAKNCAFASVVNNPYTLDVTLKDGTKLTLPKQYTVSFSYEDGTPFIGDTLTMKMVSGGDKKRLLYTTFGPAPAVSTLCEGGFEATPTVEKGQTYIAFHAPAIFQTGVGKVMVIVTFGNGTAAVPAMRTFYFKREE